jgi:hypothetical protein
MLLTNALLHQQAIFGQHRCVTHFSCNALRNERQLKQWRFGASIRKPLGGFHKVDLFKSIDRMWKIN